VLFTLILYTIAACKKSSVPLQINSSIVGKWKLSESYSDPGDGSGTWQKADPLNPSYLTFNPDGSLDITPPDIYNPDHYKLTSDSTMFFYRGSDSIYMRYSFSETLLSIYPPCIEGCGERYIPVP
jgi:hypothetical protein